MEVSRIINDLRIWVAAAVVLGFVIGPNDLPASSIIVVSLMIQMIVSVDGIKFRADGFSKYRRVCWTSILLSFGFNTAVTLAAGSLFINDNQAMWYGWVMLAVMPCAVSTISTALIKNENLEVSVIAVSAVYVSAIVLTPLLSHFLMGEAVRAMEILMYIVLFIFIPLIVSIPLRRLKLTRNSKLPVINLLLFIVIFLSISRNRDYIFDSTELIVIVIAVAAARIVVLHFGSALIIKKLNIGEDSRTVMLVLSVWKNTGLSISMCMALLPGMEIAVIPCIISLILEDIWFSIVTKGSYSGNGPQPLTD